MSFFSNSVATVWMVFFFLTSNFCDALLPQKNLFSPNSRISAEPRNSWSCLGAATIAPERVITKEPVTAPKEEKDYNSAKENDFDGNGDMWEIRILDNDYHFDYQVAEILVKVANLSEIQAYRAMRTAEKQGSCSIGEYDYEMAEHYTNALLDHHLGAEMNPLGFQ